MIFGTALNATPMTTDLQTIRVFLASSAELKPDREAFEQFIARRNKDWRPRGVFLHLDIWEDLSAAISPTRSQDEYNREIDRCDIFVVLFWTKVGRYTAEEFERAHGRFKGDGGSAGAPTIFTYLRTTPARAGREETQSLWAFQDRLAELKHFPAEYDSADKLQLEFGLELDRLVPAGLIRLDRGSEVTDADRLRREHLAIRETYLDWLRREFDSVELLGLDLKESRNIGLGHVYVPAVTDDYIPLALGRHEHDVFRLLMDSFPLLAMLGRSPLYVPGAAGSGKSTFCRWLALVAAEGVVPQHRKIEVGDPRFAERLPDTLLGRLPLLVRLRDWASYPEFLVGGGRWTRAQIERSLADWLDKIRPGGLTSELFLAELEAGQCLLILDGVDEVPESRGLDLPRRNLLSGLADALPTWRKNGNWLLLTSRPYGLEAEDRRRLDLPTAKLAELPHELQVLFVRRWFDAVDPPRAAEKAEGLLGHLAQRADLVDMRSNPMLLTALCVKYDEGRRLPQDFYSLYDAVVRQVLYKRCNTENERDQARNRLGAIALGMHRGEAGTARQTPAAEVTVEEVDRVLADLARQDWASESGAEEASAKRELLLSDSGLLLPRDNRRTAFYHLSFQEFLAAERLQKLRELPEDILAMYADTPAWRRTLRFLFCAIAERESPERALTAWRTLLMSFEPVCLNVNPAPGLLLADCLEVAHAKGWCVDDFKASLRTACDHALYHLLPEPRMQLWLTLGRLGLDDRPGVGVRPDGLPDIEWCEVSAGAFQYGDPPRLQRHETPFLIARYPVTFRQFQVFVTAGGYCQDEWWDGLAQRPEPIPSTWSEPNAPREQVSWYEAVAFCRWLSATFSLMGVLPDGWQVRLPTEAEWERAARGTDGRRFPWCGDIYLPGFANIDETETKGGSKLNRTSPVGIFPSGEAPSGALDMSGNLWEWCCNGYTTTDADGHGSFRDLRGGCWRRSSDYCRAASRLRSPLESRNDYIGFRLCAAPVSS